MKKFTKNLADVIVLAEVAEHLYERAEMYEFQVEDYKKQLKEDKNEWIEECLAQAEAKMSAYIRLAERITK